MLAQVELTVLVTPQISPSALDYSIMKFSLKTWSTLVCPYILLHVGLDIQLISRLNGPLRESGFLIHDQLRLS